MSSEEAQQRNQQLANDVDFATWWAVKQGDYA